jgi:hypothetical protein
MADAVGRHPEVALATPDPSITTFRHVPRDLRTAVGEDAADARPNALNRDVLDRLLRGGEALVSNATSATGICCGPAS